MEKIKNPKMKKTLDI